MTLRSWIGRIPGWASVIFLAGVAALPAQAQVNLGGTASDFVTRSSDDQGGSTVIKGAAAKTLPSGIVELKSLVIEMFPKKQEKDLTITAPHCFFDPKSGTVTSADSLTVQKVDGSFALQGVGFRFQQSNSHLVVSNQVQAAIRRALVDSAGKPAARSEEAVPRQEAAVPGLPAAEVEPAAKPENTIEISSGHFDYRAERAVFRNRVQARQETSQLRCGLLTVRFAGPGGEVERIDAEEAVEFEQGEARSRSQKAVYLMNSDIITLTGEPAWSLGDREGSGEVILINNKTKAFQIRRQVAVKFLADRLLPLEWFGVPANAPTSQTNVSRPFQITAEELDYETDTAVFRGQVQAADEQGLSLGCEEMTATFAGAEGKLSGILAKQNVTVERGGVLIRAQRADYSAANELAVFTGDPAWKLPQGEGRSRELVFDPVQKQVRARGAVEMRIMNSSGELGFHFGTNPAATQPASPESMEVVIASEELISKTGSAIFLNGVRVSYPEDPARELACEVLAAFFGAGQELDYLVAEDRVQIRQGDLLAGGGKAVYQVSKGLIELSRDPSVRTKGREFFADEFILDRANNSFRMKGAYRVVLDRAAMKERRLVAP